MINLDDKIFSEIKANNIIQNLKELNLESNKLTSVGFQNLLEIYQDSFILNYLNLSNNSFEEVTLEQIDTLLEKGRRLVKLDIGFSGISVDLSHAQNLEILYKD